MASLSLSNLSLSNQMKPSVKNQKQSSTVPVSVTKKLSRAHCNLNCPNYSKLFRVGRRLFELPLWEWSGPSIWMWIDITWSNVVFWRRWRLYTTGESKNNLTNSNNLFLRKVKLLDVKWFDKMIYRLILYMDLVILSQLRKKKRWCVSVYITKKDAICKLKTHD